MQSFLRARWLDLTCSASRPPASLAGSRLKVARLLYFIGGVSFIFLFSNTLMAALVGLLHIPLPSAFPRSWTFPLAVAYWAVAALWVGWVKRSWETGQDVHGHRVFALALLGLGWNANTAIDALLSGHTLLSQWSSLALGMLLLCLAISCWRALRSPAPVAEPLQAY